jgi:hypothetical protein
MPHHCGAVRVLHDAFETHAAGLLEHEFAVRIGVVDHRDSRQPAIDQARQALLASAERQRPAVDAIELEQVEGEQHGLADGAAPVERIEDRDAVRPARCPFRPGQFPRRGDSSPLADARLMGRMANRPSSGFIAPCISDPRLEAAGGPGLGA